MFDVHKRMTRAKEKANKATKFWCDSILMWQEGPQREKRSDRAMAYGKRAFRFITFFFTYTGSFCSLIMAETISLQPLPIRAHKEIKTAAPSPGFSCCSERGELSRPQN